MVRVEQLAQRLIARRTPAPPRPDLVRDTSFFDNSVSNVVQDDWPAAVSMRSMWP
jgi:hypothetical protein